MHWTNWLIAYTTLRAFFVAFHQPELTADIFLKQMSPKTWAAIVLIVLAFQGASLLAHLLLRDDLSGITDMLRWDWTWLFFLLNYREYSSTYSPLAYFIPFQLALVSIGSEGSRARAWGLRAANASFLRVPLFASCLQLLYSKHNIKSTGCKKH